MYVVLEQVTSVCLRPNQPPSIPYSPNITGGPTAAILALNNPLITFSVLDKDPLRIRQWNSKHLPIHETGLPEIIRICRDGTRSFTLSRNPDISKEELHIPARAPNLFFSTDVEKCMREADMIIIAVNTPTKNYGIGAGKATDMTAVEAVVRDVARWARDGTVLVEKSTVPCRTGEFIAGLLRTHRPTHTFPILSNPEFLSAGTAIQDLLSPDRVLIGSSPTSPSPHATHHLTSLYHFLPPAKIIHTSLASSELSKLVSNAMLAQRISSINSIACIAEHLWARIRELGIGCLVYLAEGLGLHEVAGYWRGVVGMNEWVRRRWVERVVGCVGGGMAGLRGKRVAVLGWAFKRGTGDVRESVAGEVLAGVLGERPDEVRVWDGGCEGEVLREEVRGLEGRERVRVEEGLYAACEGADVLLICRELEDPIPSPEEPKGEVKEPISFTGLYPTEMELLQLSKTLSSISGAGEADPLNRLNPEPACEPDCEKCEREKKDRDRKTKGEGRTDWKRIIKGMNTPRWIFDGRGVLDKGVMEKIGRELGVEVRVVGVGSGCDFEGGMGGRWGVDGADGWMGG
ncbi:UDP-glucose 6-dehydrogenase protein [Rutstroemia sp. NJR-2017a BBW]|nr:UDP-glucose 6-dehydrogenase protein [Rutstroemia sp. NJR-2017a BBW]